MADVTVSCEAWAAVAAALPHPWPAEAVAIDLAYWAACDEPRPGQLALARRWGVSRWQVRQWLKMNDDSPARRQPAASPPPAAASSKANNRGDSASPPPARRQPAASPRGKADNSAGTVNATRARSRGNNPPPTTTTTNMSEVRGSGGRRSAADDCEQSPDSESVSEATDQPREPSELERVMDHWRRHRPRLRVAPRGLRTSIRVHGVESVCQVIDWLHTSPHDRARFVREGRHWGVLGQPAKVETYLEMMQATRDDRHNPGGWW